MGAWRKNLPWWLGWTMGNVVCQTLLTLQNKSIKRKRDVRASTKTTYLHFLQSHHMKSHVTELVQTTHCEEEHAVHFLESRARHNGSNLIRADKDTVTWLTGMWRILSMSVFYTQTNMPCWLSCQSLTLDYLRAAEFISLWGETPPKCHTQNIPKSSCVILLLTKK